MKIQDAKFTVVVVYINTILICTKLLNSMITYKMETKRICQLTALLGLLVNFYYEKVGNKKIKRKVVFNVSILSPTC